MSKTKPKTGTPAGKLAKRDATGKFTKGNKTGRLSKPSFSPYQAVIDAALEKTVSEKRVARALEKFFELCDAGEPSALNTFVRKFGPVGRIARFQLPAKFTGTVPELELLSVSIFRQMSQGQITLDSAEGIIKIIKDMVEIVHFQELAMDLKRLHKLKKEL